MQNRTYFPDSRQDIRRFRPAAPFGALTAVLSQCWGSTGTAMRLIVNLLFNRLDADYRECLSGLTFGQRAGGFNRFADHFS